MLCTSTAEAGCQSAQDGHISEAEVDQALEQNGEFARLVLDSCGICPSTTALMAAIDLDRSGTISLAELERFLCAHNSTNPRREPAHRRASVTVSRS